MSVRLAMGLALALVTVPVLALGLIDPLEGGLALLVGGVLVALTWAVSRVPVPRLEWISWSAGVVLAIASLVSVTLVRQSQGLPMRGAEGLPAWLWVLVVAYEVCAAVALAGGVQYVVRHVRALRHATPARTA